MLYQRIVEYCERNGLSISAFEKHCELANGTVAKWKDSPNAAKLETVMRIVAKTGIPITRWIE